MGLVTIAALVFIVTGTAAAAYIGGPLGLAIAGVCFGLAAILFFESRGGKNGR